MNEYLEQAKNFLNKANAKCEIVYGGISRNENWKEKEKRNWYDVTITTPRGKMTFTFWDSIHNTEISTMTFEEYVTRNAITEKGNADISRALEETLYRILQNEGTDDDVYRIMGAKIPTREERKELEEFDEYTGIDLGYVLPGLIDMWEEVK